MTPPLLIDVLNPKGAGQILFDYLDDCTTLTSEIPEARQVQDELVKQTAQFILGDRFPKLMQRANVPAEEIQTIRGSVTPQSNADQIQRATKNIFSALDFYTSAPKRPILSHRLMQASALQDEIDKIIRESEENEEQISRAFFRTLEKSLDGPVAEAWNSQLSEWAKAPPSVEDLSSEERIHFFEKFLQNNPIHQEAVSKIWYDQTLGPIPVKVIPFIPENPFILFEQCSAAFNHDQFEIAIQLLKKFRNYPGTQRSMPFYLASFLLTILMTKNSCHQCVHLAKRFGKNTPWVRLFDAAAIAKNFKPEHHQLLIEFVAESAHLVDWALIRLENPLLFSQILLHQSFPVDVAHRVISSFISPDKSLILSHGPLSELLSVPIITKKLGQQRMVEICQEARRGVDWGLIWLGNPELLSQILEHQNFSANAVHDVISNLIHNKLSVATEALHILLSLPIVNKKLNRQRVFEICQKAERSLVKKEENNELQAALKWVNLSITEKICWRFGVPVKLKNVVLKKDS